MGKGPVKGPAKASEKESVKKSEKGPVKGSGRDQRIYIDICHVAVMFIYWAYEWQIL